MAAASLALVLSGRTSAQTGTLEIPTPTPQGRFEGTWAYTDPGFKIAIFVQRDEAGVLRVRYQLRSREGVEFHTDAGGVARYLQEGVPVKVRFTGSPNKEEDLIQGRFERTVTSKAGTSVESGDFRMYRCSKGKGLVLHYPLVTYEWSEPGGQKRSTSQPEVLSVFRKVSEIVVDFDEIRF